MGIPTILLLTTVSFCVMGQLTRDPKYGTTEGRVSCLEDTFMRLESYGTAMRKKMAVIEESNDRRFESIQERFAALEATNAAQSEEINALKTKNEELDLQLREHAEHHETELNAAEERIESLEGTNAVQSDEINALKADDDEMHSQLLECAATNAAQTDEINALKTDNEDIGTQLSEHAATNAAQTDEIDALKADNEDIDTQLREHAATDAAQTDEINALKADNEDIDTQLREHAAINAAQTVEINALKADNEAIDTQLREHAATNAAQTDEINALKADNEDIDTQLSEHAAINEAQNDEINEFKADNEEHASPQPEHAVRPSCSETFDLISSPRYGVPDSSLTASLERYSNKRASSSRLNSTTCWAGSSNVRPIWIKVDFGQDRIVKSIQTARNGDRSGYWVKRYTISTSQDGVTWSNIQENGEDLVFNGNTNDNPDAIVTNQLPAPIQTIFVRLNVVGWKGIDPGLRWVVGCPV